MKTSIFTKVIDSQTLFVFEFHGDQSSPYNGGSEIRRGLLTAEGFKETKVNTPSGVYTKVDDLDFEKAIRTSLANKERLEAEHKAKEEAEKKRIKEIEQNSIKEHIGSPEGWYDVTVTYCVNDFFNGGHKTKTKSALILAKNGYDAYVKMCDKIEEADGFWIEPIYKAMIGYVGILTDEVLQG